ncbi:hypothetical protein MGYG_05289 [Nannizzia gypsea CBS 118893]|uniref:Uncharacterized protein n=1 Tax=Arthroderma gypseum (strain ATCC MYA-4604 / CBS 118893) TaxID=535722 RepID=E4UVG4_ARTGP|nr:hypothetical protein MGYG_05289 [Nannizzia gypsea CBS 118893]EFR02291.1 hypothetical protein MGYG_05289 [Nannizzia gypsea CBS 118893]
MSVDCHAEQHYLATFFLKCYGIFPDAVGHEAGKLANNTLDHGQRYENQQALRTLWTLRHRMDSCFCFVMPYDGVERWVRRTGREVEEFDSGTSRDLRLQISSYLKGETGKGYLSFAIRRVEMVGYRLGTCNAEVVRVYDNFP